MNTIDIVFDGPPGPESGRFVEVENEYGASISVGEWIARNDGYWALRIPDPRPETAVMSLAVDVAQLRLRVIELERVSAGLSK